MRSHNHLTGRSPAPDDSCDSGQDGPPPLSSTRVRRRAAPRLYDSGMPTRVARRVVPWMAIVVVLLLLSAATRVAQVHAETWEWRLWPSAAPPRVQFEGRHYLRTSIVPVSSDGLVPSGETLGGATIFVGSRVADLAPIGIAVVDNVNCASTASPAVHNLLTRTEITDPRDLSSS